ncbi:conserved hypothetical protein [Pseudarthrobacter chlorophenolicus A6]|uniref:Uncharacterized protein n=1 Tax=Pseudarthrobacter chlorophenolicus (strain ATCC 700700 / DSM 12829 / CIP 107037 / JCM 12360 / KCTC 9906 / NCIMB 13794 / A6) TaxID=452863 RepID=B8HEP9_PSECP|nr:hypothetical protein [Pseudarthrobacter chlorophenolicus]ACL39165.1 conserved hypothetical protein [Pseudarthrobacter chlorophenolicus A6]SDR03374.1 hypothetical protein SAMN04489738_4353 [Pseudarthrobacter chlorophenolicus]
MRTLLLAGAAAIGWLTLSSTAASADTLSETSSLLGGVTTSVASSASSVAGKVAGTVPTDSQTSTTAVTPAPAPVPARPSGLLQPVASQLLVVADNLVSSVPVVSQVVPAGTVSAVAVPIVEAADRTTAALVEAAVPPVAEAVPVLEPVLVPVSGLVTGSDPLPLPLPDLSGTVPLDELPASEPVPAAGNGVVEPAQGAAVAVESETFGAAGPARIAAVNIEAPALSAIPGFGSAFLAETAGIEPAAHHSGGGEPATDNPVQQPAQSPAVPGTGTGSGGPASPAFGSAAWLSAYDFDHLLSRAVLARDDREHTPAPVSFDPGSSPD